MKKLPAMAMLALAAAAMQPTEIERGYAITNPYAGLESDYGSGRRFKPKGTKSSGLRAGLNQKQKRKAWANNPRIRPLKNRR
jgi:hypothetical protein